MLDRVTITGADDETPIGWMQETQERYPFLEWGILASRDREGTPRYPSRQWIAELAEVAQGGGLKIAMHVCGAWARQIFEGTLDWSELPAVRNYAKRVQVNGVPGAHAERGAWMLRDHDKQFIFQYPAADGFVDTCRAKSVDAVRLFDLSGGRGVRSDGTWADVDDEYVGYAGGITPVTAQGDVEVLNGMRAHRFWIDMESGVRFSGKLDTGMVESVAQGVISVVCTG